MDSEIFYKFLVELMDLVDDSAAGVLTRSQLVSKIRVLIFDYFGDDPLQEVDK